MVEIDGFGSRLQTFDPEGGANDPIEILTFVPELVDAPEFATALGARVARLGAVRHTFYARVRRLDRPSPTSLRLVSDHVPGWRLSQVLALVEHRHIALDISAILSLLRQLVPAVSLFARHQRDLALGVIGPERLIVTPQGRLVLAEYVLGPAIEKLAYTRERLWRTLRVALPTGGASRISPRADVLGIGIVVLSLLHGRLLRDEEYSHALADLLQKATESSGGNLRPLSAGLSAWLGRSLQLDARTAFQSPHEAQVAFEEVLASERAYVTTPALLDAFIANFVTLAGPPPEPVPLPQEPTPPKTPPPVLTPTPEPAPTVELPQSKAPTAVETSAPPPAPPPDTTPAPPPAIEVPIEAPAVEPAAAPARSGRDAKKWLAMALAASALLVLLESIALVWIWNRWSSETLARDGELVVRSLPVGARVRIDQEDRGVTPLTVRLPPGNYTLEVQAGDAQPRVLVVQIRPGIQTAQYVELQPTAPQNPQSSPKSPAKNPGSGKGRKN